MNNLRVSGLITILCGLLHLSVTAQQSVLGSWELVYIAPTYMEDTDPRGITNIRLHFTSSGKLFNIWPDEILSDNTESVKFNFEQNILKILPGNNEPYLINVTFQDSGTMVFESESSSKRIFKRLDEPDAVNKIIEPKSLQLVRTEELTDEKVDKILYDDNDYSSNKLNERIIGIWEVIEYKGVPNGEMPPYGFLNDIWTIKNNELSIFQRVNRETADMKYVLTVSGEILITAPDGSALAWKCTFNKWGQLLLDSGDGIVILKLVTKDINDNKSIPLKVVLLKLKGED